MHLLTKPLATLSLSLLTLTTALEITSPTSGSTVSLSSPLLIEWTSDASDPPSFTLELVNLNPSSSAGTVTLATAVSTFAGSYTIPQTVVADLSHGTGFQIWAVSAAGEPLGQSGDFDLAGGLSSLSTASGGGVSTVVTSSTSTQASPVPTNPAAGGVSVSTTTSSSVATVATRKGTPVQLTSASASSTSSSASSTSTTGSGNSGSPFDTGAAVAVKQSFSLIAAAFGCVLAVLA